jgi:hypothetical protein
MGNYDAENYEAEKNGLDIGVDYYVGSEWVGNDTDRHLSFPEGLGFLADTFEKYVDQGGTFIDAEDGSNIMRVAFDDGKSMDITFRNYKGKAPYTWHDAKTYSLTRSMDDNIPAPIEGEDYSDSGISDDYSKE